MIRFLFRFLAVVALSVAVIMAVIDATRSIAASGLAWTPLASNWHGASPGSFAAFQSMVERAMPTEFWNLAVSPLLALPGFLVFLVLALVLYALGRKPSRPLGQIGRESREFL